MKKFLLVIMVLAVVVPLGVTAQKTTEKKLVEKIKRDITIEFKSAITLIAGTQNNINSLLAIKGTDTCFYPQTSGQYHQKYGKYDSDICSVCIESKEELREISVTFVLKNGMLIFWKTDVGATEGIQVWKNDKKTGIEIWWDDSGIYRAAMIYDNEYSTIVRQTQDTHGYQKLQKTFLSWLEYVKSS